MLLRLFDAPENLIRLMQPKSFAFPTLQNMFAIASSNGATEDSDFDGVAADERPRCISLSNLEISDTAGSPLVDPSINLVCVGDFGPEGSSLLTHVTIMAAIGWLIHR